MGIHIPGLQHGGERRKDKRRKLKKKERGKRGIGGGERDKREVRNKVDEKKFLFLSPSVCLDFLVEREHRREMRVGGMESVMELDSTNYQGEEEIAKSEREGARDMEESDRKRSAGL